MSSAATETFRAARDFLLEHRTDYHRASAERHWERLFALFDRTLRH